ncbi:3-oxoacid CoA-transferase [Strigomonas culicis]|uniref:Succinyl-CoA:3-ketoacid-coenzyme A transferase n=1 Tax=Strigomonas culicis TaxID=28005 RepID=S9TQ16_9TRYP|nr:3-oxoacid CoA-transferase [Strigomonas culicis]EPY19084.1 3-oxoacid CoA-transferase [Strigomonas culicis]|eukprot:EPY18744.1 3-oxoacid CoA-transferase [Strigomonas culicis]
MLRFSPRFLRRVPVMSASEALQDVHDGASIALGGFGFCGVAFDLLAELNRKQTKNLSLTSITMAGPEFGTGPLARDKQIKKITATFIGNNKVLSDRLMRGEFEAEFCPIGSMIDRLQAAGSGMTAFYTPTGFATPIETGRVPRRWAQDGSGAIAEYSEPRETRFINGRWCVFEQALPHDFAFVRAWKADRRGNLVFRATARNSNPSIARSAKVCIVEAEHIVEPGELDPNHIHLPGVYVHRLVQPAAPKRVAEYIMTREAGASSDSAAEDRANSTRDRIARRAALEVEKNMIINLGIGIPTLVSNYVPEEMDAVCQGENGLLGTGPHPLPGEVDTDITNASKQTITIAPNGSSVFDMSESFTMIRGGHLDLTILGALQVSSTGDIASWFVPGKLLTGMGGAMDLVNGCERVVVTMEHTEKSGASRVKQECTIPLTGKAKVQTLITNLAVFQFHTSPYGIRHMELTELAEGVTLEEVKAKTEAKFTISPTLKTMPLAPVIHH